MGLSFLVASIFIGFMLVAAFYDLFTMTIPNWLNAVVGILFFPIAFVAGYSFPEMAYNLLPAGLVLIIGFTMFALGWIQGGDAKMATVVALWMGFDHLLFWFIYMSVIGGALTFMLLGIRQFALPVFMMKYEWITRLHHPKTGVPYGIAIAAAAILVYPDTELFRRLIHSLM